MEEFDLVLDVAGLGRGEIGLGIHILILKKTSRVGSGLHLGKDLFNIPRVNSAMTDIYLL